MDIYYALMGFTIILNASSQILMKKGMIEVGTIADNAGNVISTLQSAVFNPWLILGLTTMTISMVSHILVLSKLEVGFVFPFISLAYLIVAVAGIVFFQEAFSVERFAGIGVIMFGCYLVARSA
ncbi:MAG: transporter [Lentilitoribacter sp.]